MSEKPRKKKIVWQQYIAKAFSLLIGIACGFLMGAYISGRSGTGRPFHEKLPSLAGLFFGMYAAIFMQLIIHEAGHLVFGLFTGYQFSSFRIFNLMWVKEEGGVRLRRLNIAGTGGQCLMTPPDLVDGRIPIILYNLGGALMNIIAGLIFLGLFFVCTDIPFLSTVMLFFAVTGFFLAVMNGVPMRMGTVNNDGHNAFALMRSPEAMRAFWVQLKVNEQIAKGIRLKDMPDEWFTVPSDEAMKNSMTAVIGVFACNRLMDAEKFEEADKLMAHMLKIDSGIMGLHRSLIICDRMYVELITENRNNVLDGMFTKEQKKFMRSMKSFPSVLRTEYAYALLCEADKVKADKIKIRFEKCTKAYPYQNDVQSERELMEIAQTLFHSE